MTMLESAKRNLIFLISSTDIFAVSLIIPLYTQHLKSINFSNVSVGLLNSLYAGIQFFASPVIGHLSDVYGSRSVLVVSMLICALCYPALGAATSFAAVAAVRIALGLVKHTQLLCKHHIEERATATAADSRLADAKKGDGGGAGDRPRDFGKLSAFMSLGYAVGPIIGGHFIDSPNGFAGMCVVTGLFFVLNCAFAWSLAGGGRRSLAAAGPKLTVVAANFFASFKSVPWSACWDLFLLKSLTVFALFSFYLNYNASVTGRFGLSSVHLGYSLSLQGVVRAATGFAVRPILDLFPRASTVADKLRVVYLLMTSNLVALYLCDNFYAYLACLVPFNTCLCFVRIVNHEALVERVADRNTGIVLGAFNNVTAITRFTLPLLSGYLADRYGPDSAYAVSVASLLAALCVIVISRRTARRSDTRPKVE